MKPTEAFAEDSGDSTPTGQPEEFCPNAVHYRSLSRLRDEVSGHTLLPLHIRSRCPISYISVIITGAL